MPVIVGSIYYSLEYMVREDRKHKPEVLDHKELS